MSRTAVSGTCALQRSASRSIQTSHKSPTSRTSLKSKQIQRRKDNPQFLKRTTRERINWLRFRHSLQFLRVRHPRPRTNRATRNLKARLQLQTTKSKQILRRRDSRRFRRKTMRERTSRFPHRLQSLRAKRL